MSREVALVGYKLWQTRKIGAAHVPVDTIDQGKLSVEIDDLDGVVDRMIEEGWVLVHPKSPREISLDPSRLAGLAGLVYEEHPDSSKAERMWQHVVGRHRSDGEEREDVEEERVGHELDPSAYVTRSELSSWRGKIERRVSSLAGELREAVMDNEVEVRDPRFDRIESKLGEVIDRLGAVEDRVEGRTSVEGLQRRVDALEDEDGVEGSCVFCGDEAVRRVPFLTWDDGGLVHRSDNLVCGNTKALDAVFCGDGVGRRRCRRVAAALRKRGCTQVAVVGDEVREVEDGLDRAGIEIWR